MPKYKIRHPRKFSQHHVPRGEKIVQSLVDKGFYVAWMNVSASSIGAPHRRLRWFCIAFRDLKLPPLQRILQNDWDSEKSTRLVPYRSDVQKRKLRRRCELLGNSVVPQCIQAAWNHVADIVHHPIGSTRRHKNVMFLLTHRGLFSISYQQVFQET